jgi:hypothetical protein
LDFVKGIVGKMKRTATEIDCVGGGSSTKQAQWKHQRGGERFHSCYAF